MKPKYPTRSLILIVFLFAITLLLNGCHRQGCPMHFNNGKYSPGNHVNKDPANKSQQAYTVYDNTQQVLM